MTAHFNDDTEATATLISSCDTDSRSSDEGLDAVDERKIYMFSCNWLLLIKLSLICVTDPGLDLSVLVDC